jgi:alanyl-tRNA synthetase
MEKRGHAIIPSATLVPEGDATTLFTSAGMQPMMPYLLGQKHPLGTRIADSQKCFRSVDIDEIGDSRHTTFFEMLGNWSLGDYFKKEQLNWFFTFLTNKDEGLGLDPNKLFVTVFEGGSGVKKDNEAIEIWKSLFAKAGIETKEGDHIFAYSSDKNWWSRAGAPDYMPAGEPGGPDSEVFFDFGEKLKLHENSPFKNSKCHPNCDCGRFLEIGNSVFMQYLKNEDGSLVDLPSKNIDFGGGLTRLEAAVNSDPDMFKISSLLPIIQEIEKLSNKSYRDLENQPPMRVIADHITAATFLIKDGVFPCNKAQGYVLRRLIRRAAVKMYFLTSTIDNLEDISTLSPIVTKFYSPLYFDFKKDTPAIQGEIKMEIIKFAKALGKGIKDLQKNPQVDGKAAFDLYQSYGFPLEITAEVLSQMGQKVDIEQFQKEFLKHKELSRTSSVSMFKGGLADNSETVTAYHTVTHLLHASLRQILGEHVGQKGSNITFERLRFDFSHKEKLSDKEIHLIERLINQKIQEKLPVLREELPKEKALEKGALAFFGQKYPDIVSVYTIGDEINPFSRELCGGPHVTNTQELAKIKVVKQESLGAGTRRLYIQFEK